MLALPAILKGMDGKMSKMKAILWFCTYGVRNAMTLWLTCGLGLRESLVIEWMVAGIDVQTYFEEKP